MSSRVPPSHPIVGDVVKRVRGDDFQDAKGVVHTAEALGQVGTRKAKPTDEPPFWGD